MVKRKEKREFDKVNGIYESNCTYEFGEEVEMRSRHTVMDPVTKYRKISHLLFYFLIAKFGC